MRLSNTERNAILNAVEESIRLGDFHLFLFGSRTKDLTRGGDIDLLLLLDEESYFSRSVSIKIAILNAVEKAIGERRVDLTMAPKDPARQSEFVKDILASAQLLGQRTS